MKDFIKLFSIYNKNTNEELCDKLSQIPIDALFTNRNTFYSSLGNLFLHLLNSSKYLQNMIRMKWNEKYFVSSETETEFQVNPHDFLEASQLLAKYDSNLVLFSNQVEERDLIEGKAEILLYDSKRVSVTIGEVISQYVVHQVHHRGQISQMLDEDKIEHDIGNIWPFVSQIH